VEDNEGLAVPVGPACPWDPVLCLWHPEGHEDSYSATAFLEDEAVDRGVDAEVEGGQDPWMLVTRVCRGARPASFSYGTCTIRKSRW
jgi:hypothetical protein